MEETQESHEKFIGGIEKFDVALNRGSKRELKDFKIAGEKWEIYKKNIRKIAFTCYSGKVVFNVYRESVIRDPETISAGVHQNYTLSWGTARVVFEALEPSRIYMHVEWDK